MSELVQAPARKQSVAQAAPLEGHILQRKCACGNHSAGGECEKCRNKQRPLERATTGANDLILHEPGVGMRNRTLDLTTRALMETKFGRDFSEVRIHTDQTAAKAAASHRAAAFASGTDISFAAGRYRPDAESGRALLAHELTHVVQSANAIASPAAEETPTHELEREATRMALAVRASAPQPPIVGISRDSGRPMMAPEGDGKAPTYGSLSPRIPEAKYVAETVELKKYGGKWIEIGAEGQRTANGSYSFALRDGRLYGSRYGHLEASGGARVRLAGDIRFNNGELTDWNVGSGSYKPVESFIGEVAEEAKKAGLDLEYDKDPAKSKFRPITEKSGQRQLPTIQEPKGTTLSKGRSAGGMRPPTGGAPASPGPDVKSRARLIAGELGEDLRLMRTARILNTIARVVEFAGQLAMVYQSLSMAASASSGKGFILTERIKQSEELRDQANDLNKEYPAFSDRVQSRGFSLFAAGADPDAIGDLVSELSDLGATISEQRVDLNKQSKRVKAALKEIAIKRQATAALLDDPKAVAALDPGGGTLNVTIVWAADQDLSRIESALMQADRAWDSVLGMMNADIEFVAAWADWLETIAIKAGKMKPTPTITVTAEQVKELSDKKEK
jgi:Domain of unknown function (DUF4157)